VNIVLESREVLLRPIALSDAEDLWKNIGDDEDVWNWVMLKYSVPRSLGDMRNIIETRIAAAEAGERYTFAVYSKEIGEVVGSTAIIDPNNKGFICEIGGTFFSQEVRGRGLNTQCKLLLIKYAFETLGMQRVTLKADILNERSLRAISRIGGKEEGVSYSDRIRRDGTRRETMTFRILSEEWSQVKLNLETQMDGAAQREIK
jgi:RimJ/RimL family protein N-acetyltransferase